MKAFLVLITLLTSQSVFAINCTAMVLTATEELEKRLNVPFVNDGHGGSEFMIQGQENRVLIMADGKWLGIRWEQNGEAIGESVTLLRDAVTQPRVLIMYNPNNLDEQVSISCE